MGFIDRGRFRLVKNSTMDAEKNILLVDDDLKIRDGVAAFLRSNGLHVSTAASGQAMRAEMMGAKIDLVVLDLMLGGEDGLSLLREIRSSGTVPVIMLTAVAGEFDRVVGLELGAEDYICKPFSLRELLARIRVVLRRRFDSEHRVGSGPSYRFAGWSLDARARLLASPSGGHVELTTGEFELLQAFVEHPNTVLNRDQLLDLIHGRSIPSIDRTIDVKIMRLRRKIEPEMKAPRLIKTVRNGGYIFTPVVTRGAL
jgi:two-component system, OmpR family, response regulator